MKWWPDGIPYRNPTGTPKMNLKQCNQIITSFIIANVGCLPEILVLRETTVLPYVIIILTINITMNLKFIALLIKIFLQETTLR